MPGAGAPAPCSPASAPCSTTTRAWTCAWCPPRCSRCAWSSIRGSRRRPAARLLAAARRGVWSTAPSTIAERRAALSATRRRDDRCCRAAGWQGRPRSAAATTSPAAASTSCTSRPATSSTARCCARAWSTNCSSTWRRSCSATAASWPAFGPLDDAGRRPALRYCRRAGRRRRPAPAAAPARRRPAGRRLSRSWRRRQEAAAYNRAMPISPSPSWWPSWPPAAWSSWSTRKTARTKATWCSRPTTSRRRRSISWPATRAA